MTTRKWIVTWLALTVAFPAHAQDAVLTESCTQCRIRITKVTELRDDLTGQPEFITKLSDGSYLTVLYRSRSDIRMFRKNGEFTRTIGRRGAGPGEYKDVTDIAVGAGDTLFVFDPGNGRLTILEPSFHMVRAVPLQGHVREGFTLADGRIVFNAGLMNKAGLAAPIHVLNLRNGKLRSFGADAATLGSSDARHLLFRTTIAKRNDFILAASQKEYNLETWSPEGRLLKRVRRSVGWFKSWKDAENISPRHPPQTSVHTIAVDREGLVWVAISVPGKRYMKGLSEKPVTREGQTFYDVLRVDLVYETVIEAIDLERNAVLASTRLDKYFVGWVAESNEFATYEEREDGPVITIWRASLSRPKAQ